VGGRVGEMVKEAEYGKILCTHVCKYLLKTIPGIGECRDKGEWWMG
jgi:hypothetical protein